MSSSGSETPTLDHEAIRAVGADMTRYIGVLAELQDDRELILERLNACAEQVPYEALFAEDDRLTGEVESTTVDHSELDLQLGAEIVRLDKAAELFVKRMPEKAKAAQAQAEQKKQEYAERINVEKALLDAPRLAVEAERGELRSIIDTVSAAWPVAPYPEEVLAAASTAEEIAGGDSDVPIELGFELDAHLESRREQREWLASRGQRQTHEEELGDPGPHAELAASIPALSEQLQSHASEHVHIDGGIETAQEAVLQAVSKPAEERSERENILLKAIHVLQTRFLARPGKMNFLKVYEADDIISLAEKLHAFSKKNRPDFEGLEGRILDMAAIQRPLLGREVPSSVKDATQRMEKDAPNRTGMQWSSLSKFANRASENLRGKLLVGGSAHPSQDYVIEVADRSGTTPNLSSIYQFVADDFAFEVLGRRRTVKQATAQERFKANCDLIEAWLKEAGPLLDQIPRDFRMRRRDERKHSFRRHQPQRAQYDSSPAGPRIRKMIEDIKIRRDGTGDPKTPRHKPMKFDPSGALNHQLRLGHMIDALRAELRVYDAPTEGRTEEIKPFA
jgi:hypothetical protein